MRADGAVERGEGEAGRDNRGDDAVELVLAGDACAEGEGLKDIARVVVEGGDGGARETVGETDAGHAGAAEELAQRGRRGDVEAFGRLVVVGQQRVLRIGEVRALTVGDGVALGRVVVGLLVEDLDAERDRLVAQVGLGKAKAEIAREVADVGVDRERLAEAEEVVGLVVEADERTRETADAAVEADGVLALLLQLDEQVDGAGVGVLMGLDVLVGLEGVEVVELIQAEE